MKENYSNLVTWIKRVIDSCENTSQVSVARKLINLFQKQTKNEKLTLELRHYSVDKLISLNHYGLGETSDQESHV